MRVKFFCNNGANALSCREETFDTVDDFGMNEGQWERLSEDEKYAVAKEWAHDRIEIGFVELE
jgi:hypothetical protein